MRSPARLVAMPTPQGPVVVVGIALEERNDALAGLATLLWIGGPVLLIVVSGLAWFLAGAALRPVERIRQETSAISEGDLEKRLQVPATGDEIARLATTLNEMLARLEQAFERERRFVDDASHELRTPLGILRTELELALRRSRTREEMRRRWPAQPRRPSGSAGWPRTCSCWRAPTGAGSRCTGRKPTPRLSC